MVLDGVEAPGTRREVVYCDPARVEAILPPHPSPLLPPEGFQVFANAPDLCFRCEAAHGGAPLSGTEALAVVLFNGGYSIDDATIRLSGLDAAGRTVFAIEQWVHELPRGGRYSLEIPSYEMPGPIRELGLALLSCGCLR